MTPGPPMIGRPGEAGWITFKPARLNRMVSRPGFAFAATIASRRLQCATEHEPSSTSLFELTVYVPGVATATVVVSFAVLSASVVSGWVAVTVAEVDAIPAEPRRASTSTETVAGKLPKLWREPS